MASDLMSSPSFTCPAPLGHSAHVQLAHGGGGRLMHQLIERVFLSAFKNAAAAERHDGAVLRVDADRIAFTTDSYVVHPLFFPGGDIGTLAVNGTVNDLAMCGARPLYLSAGFILEEGLPIATLARVVESMQRAAAAAEVALVTGDTKVVDRGKGDGLYINTAGIGVLEHEQRVAPAQVRAGDAILLSGDLGRHGIAVMAMREGLSFETTIESDCAPLADMVGALFAAQIEVHCLRDLTRGGLATSLVEIAEASGLTFAIDERAIPVAQDVRGACELLGLDPLYVANEGRCVAFVPAAHAERALELWRASCPGRDAKRIGTVHRGVSGLVTMLSPIGTTRVIDMLSGEQLPRIC